MMRLRWSLIKQQMLVQLRVRTLNLVLPKKEKGPDSLVIAVASDIHLGVIVGRSRFDRIVRKINGLHPDIILLPGDILDEDLAPVIRQNLGESLKSLRSPLGVFACTGNHEYIGGIENAVTYLTEHGIRLLRDEAVLVNGSFWLAGREDRSIQQFSGKKRKALEEVLAGTDNRHPLVLMDHQPFRLREAADRGVDLQLSGHTHHGQLWPVNLFTGWIYESDYGYLKKGNTQFYISSGAGTWGPPIRLASSSEIVCIRVTFR
jgi:predicted MPP superfamily phosphohydrolase